MYAWNGGIYSIHWEWCFICTSIRSSLSMGKKRFVLQLCFVILTYHFLGELCSVIPAAYSLVQSFFRPPLCPPLTPDPLSVQFCFSECHINGILHYEVFGVWLPSLRKIHLNFIVLHESVVVPFYCWVVVVDYGMYHNLFIQPPVEAHQGFCQCVGINKVLKIFT